MQTRDCLWYPCAGGRGHLPLHPYFGRSVNPTPNRGTDYAHHITTPPPIFSDLPPALLRLLKQGNLVESRRYVPLLLKLSNMYRVMKKWIPKLNKIKTKVIQIIARQSVTYCHLLQGNRDFQHYLLMFQLVLWCY